MTSFIFKGRNELVFSEKTFNMQFSIYSAYSTLIDPSSSYFSDDDLVEEPVQKKTHFMFLFIIFDIPPSLITF